MLNSQFKQVEGKIVYKKIEEDAKMKEIEFKNAYIVYYKETLDVNNDVPMTIALTFSAELINVGNAALDNRWPKNWWRDLPYKGINDYYAAPSIPLRAA